MSTLDNRTTDAERARRQQLYAEKVEIYAELVELQVRTNQWYATPVDQRTGSIVALNATREQLREALKQANHQIRQCR